MVTQLRRGILAVLACAAGAFAQNSPFRCAAAADSVPVVRAEGQTELVGDVLIVCTGGVPAAAGEELHRLHFQVFTQPAVAITSRITYQQGLIVLTEALLIIDDPSPAKQTICGSPAYPYSAPQGSVRATGVCGAHPASPRGDGVGTYDPDVGPGRGNVYQGRQISNTSLYWQDVPFDSPGPNRARTVRFTNIRVNTSQLRVPNGGFAPIQLYFYGGPPVSQFGIPISNPTPVVASAVRSVAFSIPRKPAACYSCESANRAFAEDPANPLGSAGVCDGRPFLLRFDELIATAFRSRSAETGFHKAEPHPDRWPERFTDPANNSVIAGPESRIGLADSGTGFTLAFSNVPPGVTIRLPPAVALKSQDEATGLAQRIAFDGDAVVPLTDGAGSAFFEIVSSDPARLERVDIEPVISYSAPISTGTSRLDARLGLSASTNNASATAPIPRFDLGAGPAPWLIVAQCRTVILFPYVASDRRVDTGLAIVNTSLDPFTAEPDAGSCAIHYHSAGRVTTATSPVLGGGEHFTWTLSSGGALPATPGFSGFLIADCAMRSARAIAYIGDPVGPRTAYLGITIGQTAPVQTGAVSEKLDH